jgi:outer membrane lipoprotein-sorting protein
MKRFISIFVIFMTFTFTFGRAYGEMTALEIVSKLDAYRQKTFVGKMEMQVFKSGKSDRIYSFNVWINGKDLALLRYLSPSREKDNGFLKMGNNMYMYLSNTKRVMRISGRQQLSNSDFSSADILGIDMTIDYQSTLEDIVKVNTDDYYLLLLKAKTRDAVYPKIRLWVRKNDYIPLKQEYYSSSDKLLRTLIYDEFETVDGILQAKKMTMTNTLIEGEYTVITILEGKFAQTIPNSVFTIDNLTH